ncbi:MAG: hypothetical protein AAFY56_16695 [Pseudomonadota bacterium]
MQNVRFGEHINHAKRTFCSRFSEGVEQQTSARIDARNACHSLSGASCLSDNNAPCLGAVLITTPANKAEYLRRIKVEFFEVFGDTD